MIGNTLQLILFHIFIFTGITKFYKCDNKILMKFQQNNSTETKYYQLNARYYNPEIGRYITGDEIEYLDDENVSWLNLGTGLLLGYKGFRNVRNSLIQRTYLKSTLMTPTDMIIEGLIDSIW